MAAVAPIPEPAGTELASGYFMYRLAEADLPDLLALQAHVLSSMPNPEWLRANTEQMLATCLRDQWTYGVRHGGDLVAAAVLFDPGHGPESIRGYLAADTPASTTDGSDINLKLVFARPEHRRAGLAARLVTALSEHARDLGRREIWCTIHPDNVPSRTLFTRLGYEVRGQVNTCYGPRDALSVTVLPPSVAAATLPAQPPTVASVAAPAA